MYREVFLIDKSGRKIFDEQIFSHEQLIDKLLSEDQVLMLKYKRSGKDKIGFALSEGYLAGTNSDRYKEIMFLRTSVSDVQKPIIMAYKEDGYNIYNAREYEDELER